MTESITGTVNVSGFSLNYSIEGKGFPLLIPGSVLYDQRSFSNNLRKHLQLIFLDHRGFVPAPGDIAGNAAFDLDVLLADIEVARQELGLKKFFILGHSGHGFLALEYAKKYPHHVMGIAMVASAPSNSDARRNATEKAFKETASQERKELLETNMKHLPEKLSSDPGNRFMHYLLAAAPQSWYDPAFDATPLWKGVYTNMQAIDHIWGRVFRDIDITRGLGQFNKPAFLALGKYDYLTGPPELWNEVIPRFQNITVKVFDKAAHCPQYEEPVLFDKELMNWISSVAN